MNRHVDPVEQAFLATYDPRAYTPVAVTVDVAALTIRDGIFSVLLVRRANPPFAGAWCLPGGFLAPEADGRFLDLSDAAASRLALETGLAVDDAETIGRVHLEQLASFGAPDRDPRMRVISVAYLAFAPDLPEPVAGPGTLEAAWTSVTDALSMDLAFDHEQILEAAIKRARNKLEYSPLATSFLPTEFTIGALQRVYETVWGETLIESGFRRKVHTTEGFVEPAGSTTARYGEKGGRHAQLYRAGDCVLLDPPILPPSARKPVR